MAPAFFAFSTEEVGLTYFVLLIAMYHLTVNVSVEHVVLFDAVKPIAM